MANHNIDVSIVRADMHSATTGITGSAKHTVALNGKDGVKIALTGAIIRGADDLVGTEELCQMVAAEKTDEVKMTDKTVMRDGVSTITSAKKYTRLDLIALLQKSAGLTPGTNGTTTKSQQRAKAAPATAPTVATANGSTTP